MRILVLNLSAIGHHPRYTRWILDCEACRKTEIVLAGRSELSQHSALRDFTGSYQFHRVALSDKKEAILSDTSSLVALTRRQFVFWKIWRQTFDEVNNRQKVDLVVMLCADDCLDAVALRGSPFRDTPWTGIALKPTFHFRLMGVSAPGQRHPAVREWLFRRALHDRFLAGLWTIDPTLAAYAASKPETSEYRKLLFLPDPAPNLELESTSSARDALGIPENAKVVLAYGSLSERKGIFRLIECAANPSCPSNIHLLLAGEQSQEVADFLAGEAASVLKKQNRLKIIPGYVLDSEAARLLAAADCMWIGYRGFYMMSAVFVLAARHGLLCIVSDYGIAGYLARRYECALVVSPDHDESIVAALRELSQDSGCLASMSRRAMVAFSRHTVDAFQSAITTVIKMHPAYSRR